MSICRHHHHSYYAKVISGSSLGTVLGPVLFLDNKIDLHEVVVHAIPYCFADDSRLLKSISTIEDAKHLQTDLDNVVRWAEKIKWSSMK